MMPELLSRLVSHLTEHDRAYVFPYGNLPRSMNSIEQFTYHMCFQVSTVSMLLLALRRSCVNSRMERIWHTSPRLPLRSLSMSRARVSVQIFSEAFCVLTNFQASKSDSLPKIPSVQISSISCQSTRLWTRLASTASVSPIPLAVPTLVKFTISSALSEELSSVILRSTCTTTQEWVSVQSQLTMDSF